MNKITRALFYIVLFITINVGLPSCAPDQDSFFTSKKLLTGTDGSLKQTEITARLQEPMKSGQNVLWCGTFQLAWNEVESLVGEELHFANEPPLVADLNKKLFTKSDLDDASYLALAGFVRDGIYARIPQALRDKFKGQASPHLLPSPKFAPRPQDIVAYCYLFKNLQFAQPFERLDDGMEFDSAKVEGFGVPYYKRGQEGMYRQVCILDYVTMDDFVVELATKSQGDRLILAKVTPKETLEQTVRSVQKRMAATQPALMQDGDVLKVPKFNFDLTQIFRELVGYPLMVKNPKVATDLMITQAIQNIRFQMDEKGVRLRSETSMSIGCSCDYRPESKHIMVFDRPFLIMLQRADGTTPYFVLWVDNTELLMKQ